MRTIRELDATEIRVLGALMEKEQATPDYYPMTVNALIAACNQKSNRDPVMSLDETAVERAVRELDDLGLAGITRSSGGRAVKYLHHAASALEIDDEQLALLGVLLLRGPQTPGELRTRTDRYVAFTDVGAVEQRLVDLVTRDIPLVERLEREPGRREHRYRCVLTGETAGPSETPVARAAVHSSHHEPSADSALEARITALEERIARLEAELGL